MAVPYATLFYFPGGGNSNGWNLSLVQTWHDDPFDAAQVLVQFRSLTSPDKLASFPKAAFFLAYQAYLDAIGPPPPSEPGDTDFSEPGNPMMAAISLSI